MQIATSSELQHLIISAMDSDTPIVNDTIQQAVDDAVKGSNAGSESASLEEQQMFSVGSEVDDRPSVLVTNDDGINAPGLKALVQLLVETGRYNVNVCAPDSEQSAVGHCITSRSNLVVGQVQIKGATAYEVSGTPADCVSLSLSGALFLWSKPTLVISGINKGCNCGYHVIYSGTVAGAREAFICGVPSIAISYNWVRGKSHDMDFKIAAEACLPLIHAVLSNLVKGSYPQGFFLNVDVPANPSQHKGYKVTRQGTSIIRSTWKSVTPQNRLPPHVCVKDQGIGIQLAQLGLEASTAGAARRLNSAAKNVEIESVAGAENDAASHPVLQHLLFRREMCEYDCGEKGNDFDYGALQEGYVTITPLGVTSHIQTDAQTSFENWVSNVAELGVTSAL